MNDAFAAFLHALPTILGSAFVLVALLGFWRGLSLRPKDRDERTPDPVSPAQLMMDGFDGPSRWPRWLARLFGRSG